MRAAIHGAAMPAMTSKSANNLLEIAAIMDWAAVPVAMGEIALCARASPAPTTSLHSEASDGLRIPRSRIVLPFHLSSYEALRQDH